jgi:hypothetical protein
MKNNNNLMILSRLLLIISVIAVHFSFTEPEINTRSVIDLSGTWQFALDADKKGVDENWFSKPLDDSMQLPGTTDLSQKGNKNTWSSTFHLNRNYSYEGPAWYRKEVTIPENWKGTFVQLLMERTKPSKVWVDNQLVGSSILLETPQKYDLSKYLSPGKHTITICIDNNTKLTPYGGSHMYSDDTQTNWNGIIGKFYLESSDPNHITDLQVYPDIISKKIKVLMSLSNPRKLENVEVELQITKELDGKVSKLKPANFTVRCDSVIQIEYVLGSQMDLWDDYHQPVYQINATVSSKGVFKDNVRAPFGMRKFATSGTNFTINGRTVFLRGKHDACVFPLTGCPPMDAAGWERVFLIAKSYGINHYRCHTYCPPEAAFEAADKVGIYIQPELPFWGGLDFDNIAAKLRLEGLAMLKSYANHPSFVMFSPGNEIWGGHDRVHKIVAEMKAIDNRILYCQGSNNSIGYFGPTDVEDFHIAARTPSSGDTTITHTRLIQAFCDARDGGILNTKAPSTMVNFDYPVSQIKIPLVSHEVGQYQIYPDYKEIDKYTGVLKALNLVEFRNRLEKAGMLDQDMAFHNASGALAVICYRAEIEAALRTKGMAGFQLLDLQDFPGQGTALIGILDALMDSKNVVTPEEWTQFCNDVVPMVEFEKYCWANNETFTATALIANYSNKNLKNKVSWKITDGKGKLVKAGAFENADIQLGGLRNIGKIELPLKEQQKADKLTITLSIENTNYKNSYPIWVYPQPQALKKDESIQVVSRLSSEVINQLKSGKKVLLFPDAASVKQNSVAGLFNPEFWNYGMFKGISEGNKKPVSPGTMGLLIDPQHPIFNSFPTDSYTNWQWWSIIKNSNSLILNSTKANYRPIVQVIDNLERNNKMGLIFEFKVGSGKLLVCMSRLTEIMDKPEASQLYNSIVNYMKSDKFAPEYVIDEKALNEILR